MPIFQYIVCKTKQIFSEILLQHVTITFASENKHNFLHIAEHLTRHTITKKHLKQVRF